MSFTECLAGCVGGEPPGELGDPLLEVEASLEAFVRPIQPEMERETASSEKSARSEVGLGVMESELVELCGDRPRFASFLNG